MTVIDLKAERRLQDPSGRNGFEFDYLRNVVSFQGKIIHLSPHESDVLRVLLNHRARPTPIGMMITKVYGSREPDTAAASIRVAIHSLRKKVASTGLTIRATPGLGYEVDAEALPELNRRLSDKILLALNHARASGEREMIKHLQAALCIADARRQHWENLPREELAAALGS
jgi:DNA-binding winged helix-turn-helix (wHTH) protein